MTMENNQQIMQLSLAVDLDPELELEEASNDEESNDEEEASTTNTTEIVGTDLKELIEKELKL